MQIGRTILQAGEQQLRRLEEDCWSSVNKRERVRYSQVIGIWMLITHEKVWNRGMI